MVDNGDYPLVYRIATEYIGCERLPDVHFRNSRGGVKRYNMRNNTVNDPPHLCSILCNVKGAAWR